MVIYEIMRKVVAVDAFVIQTKHFLKQASESVREVKNIKDKNGIYYAHKEMMTTCLSLKTDGVW